MQSSEIQADVAIIGAGPAGLTAAYLLTKRGYRVVVIEKDPNYVGGISRTVTHNGFRFDIGGHRFFSKSREVVTLWNEILPEGFIERPRMSRIYYEGKFYSYPLRAFEALWNLGLLRSALCLASFAKAQLRPIRRVASLRDWMVNRFGERLYGIFFKTYTEKVWGMPCEEISPDWAAQRIQGLSLGKAVIDGLKRSLRLNRRPNDGMENKSLLECFLYPRLGPGMMWEAACRHVLEGGNRVMMGHALRALAWDAGPQQWHVQAETQDGTCTTIVARHVISSAPMRELAGCLRPPPLTLNHALDLKYRDFLTVALMIKSEDLFPDNWIYIHDSNVKVGRIQNFRSWSPDMVPDSSMACVGLEYFCFESDDLFNSTDEALIALATREMALLGLCSPGQVMGGAVVRQPKAYPVYDETYADNVRQVREELEGKYPTLHVVGRNGMHRYNNQDHAMMTAMLTVRNIEAGARIYDVWAVNEDAQYHEEGRAGQMAALASERLVPRRTAFKQ